jgi:hypothetical protein
VSYDGPATVAGVPVRLRGSARFEPHDGRFHWTARIAPEPRIAALVRAGRREVTVVVGDRSVPARLGEVDPWGGIRLTGAGGPPWPVADPDDTPDGSG